ncbi:cytochrome c oxidase assembly factor 1 homolog [Crocuta crocuta]
MRERVRWEVRDEDAEAQKDQAPCSRSSATFPQIPTLCTLLLESLKWTRQEAFSGASYYQLALEQLHSCPEASAALGPPLSVRCLQLTDQYNFVDIAEAQKINSCRLEIPRHWTQGTAPRKAAWPCRCAAARACTGAAACLGQERAAHSGWILSLIMKSCERAEKIKELAPWHRRSCYLESTITIDPGTTQLKIPVSGSESEGPSLCQLIQRCPLSE